MPGYVNPEATAKDLGSNKYTAHIRRVTEHSARSGRARQGGRRETVVTGEVPTSGSMLGITCWACPTSRPREEKHGTLQG